MKYIELIKQYAFSIIVMILSLYSAYILWSLYSTIYTPLIMTPDTVVSSSKQYSISDSKINDALEQLQASSSHELDIQPEEYSFGEPLLKQADTSVEVPVSVLPDLGTPN